MTKAPIIRVVGDEQYLALAFALADLDESRSFVWLKGTAEFTETVLWCRWLQDESLVRLIGKEPIRFLCPCGQRLVPRVTGAVGNQKGQMARWPYSRHDPSTGCLCSSTQPREPLLRLADVITIDAAFPVGNAHSPEHLRLRLEPVGIKVSKLIDSNDVASSPKSAAKQALRYSKALGGWIDLLAELAQTCRYRPGRRYCLRNNDFIPRLRDELSASDALSKLLDPHTVFATPGTDVGACLDAAIGSDPATLENLKGRAILISCGSDEGFINGKHTLSLKADTKCTRFQVADPVVQRIKNGRTQRMLKFVRSKPHEAFIALITLVQKERDVFVIKQASWRLIDRFGILYDSKWEFEVGQILINSKCSFIKPPSSLYRVGRGVRRPDFIVFDAAGKAFILEVDPSASKKTAIRKATRDSDYAKDNLSVIRYNPHKKQDLLQLMRNAGFQFAAC